MKVVQFHRVAVLGLFMLALSGCETWSTANVSLKTDNPGLQASSAPVKEPSSAKSPSQIFVTEGDITDRRYRVIGISQ